MLVQAVPGCNMAGAGVEKDSGASKYEIGYEVYGNVQEFNSEGERLKQLGTLAKRPENILFEEAASFPLAVQRAMEGFKTGGFEEGTIVFIVGGACWVGTLSVQLAKHLSGA